MKLVLRGMVAVAFLGFGACSSDPTLKSTCEDICDFTADCLDEDAGSCATECQDEMEIENDACQEAFIDYGQCAVDLSCDEAMDSGSEACVDEARDYLTECAASQEARCCSASDPCDWADDGFCDCDGEFDWDAGDC